MRTLDRRHFIASTLATASMPATGQGRRPNVIVMISDDQGHGDLSLHGNPHLETPHLDSIGKNGVQFTQFHVNPVCSPTRASVMTGRYYYRTGIVDTFMGRSMMHNDEVTIAELMKGAGYRTGLFGKWHLGDCYPLRSIDQGFDESLNCTGGGLTQPSDPPGNTYFDPMLRHNGAWVKRKGYCTDIFFDEAIRFVEANRNRPFFAYIATNAPHDPLQVEEKYSAPFLQKGLAEREAKIYGMVKNIDDNVGRMLGRLKDLGLDQDTIVIFMTDNGPQSPRYVSGMRGQKTTVYEGGLRVPFLLQWPRRYTAGKKIAQLAAHIDILPTLCEACGIKLPRDLQVDGRSLMPLLDGRTAGWKQRTLFFQWHRGDRPVAFQNAAALDGRWKMVEGRELYDLANDPQEKTDLAGKHPEVLQRLRKEYEAWFADVSATRNFAPPRIYLGAREENPTTLTRQDWRGAQGNGPAAVGHWEVDVRESGRYEVTLRMNKAAGAMEAQFELNGVTRKAEVAAGAGQVVFENVELPRGPGRLQARLEGGGKVFGVMYVDVRKI